MKLVIIATLVAISIMSFAGCSVKLCECNDNSPKSVSKTTDRNSSEIHVFTSPRGV